MPTSKEGQSSITVRCSKEDKEAITKKWKEYGFKSESEYIRFVALNAEISVSVRKVSEYMLNRKDIENYKGYSILQYDTENGYRVDFGTMRSKLVETIDEARKLIDYALSPDKWDK